jgi:[acyl-carrier-protein] S-malonyltransferase
MGEALEAVTILPPSLPVVSNVAAAPAVDPATIRRLLVEQVTGMVRWREGVLAMRDLEVDCLVELGNGKVLSGLTRRIEREMNSLNAGTPEEIEALLAAL